MSLFGGKRETAPKNNDANLLPSKSNWLALKRSDKSLMYKSLSMDTSSILIRFETVKNKKSMIWRENKIYNSPNPQDPSLAVIGHSVYEDGALNIFLVWDFSHTDDYSMLTLFGQAKHVPLEYLYHVVESGDYSKKIISAIQWDSERDVLQLPVKKMGGGSKRRYSAVVKSNVSKRQIKQIAVTSLAERRLQITEYFISQIYLCAELCVDRNYLAMGLLENSFSFELLITILNSPSAPVNIKAPVCRLIRCLYVDRDPQVASKFPRLIRVFGKDRHDNNELFSDFHEGSPHAFALLQKIISSYLHEQLSYNTCDELSTEMLALLFSLVKFGFYYTVEHLQDIVQPLVQILNDHKNKVGLSAVTKDTGRFAGLGAGMNKVLPEEKVDDKNDELDKMLGPGQALRSSLTMNSVVAATLAANKIRQKQNSALDGSMDAKHIKQLSQMESIPRLNAVSQNHSITKLAKNSREPDKKSAEINRQTSNMSHSSEVNAIPFIHRCLKLVESFNFLLIILIIVTLSIILTILSITNVYEAHIAGDIAIPIIFLFEIIVRMILYYSIYNNILAFFKLTVNSLDTIVVSFDVIILCLTSMSLNSNQKKIIKVLRIIRFLRSVRMIRFIRKIIQGDSAVDLWKMPARYSTLTTSESQTLSNILKIIILIHDIIQDKKMDSCMQAFSLWFSSYDADSSSKPLNAKHVLAKTMENNNALWSIIPHKFGESLTDIIMYSDSNLVQDALNLLMIHKSEKKLLYHNLRQVQLLCTEATLTKFKTLTNDFQILKRHAESFEIWRDYTSDADIRISNDMLNRFSSVLKILQISQASKLFDCDAPLQEDPEVQLMMFNMNAIDDLLSIQAVLLDKGISVVHEITKNIVTSCNLLICSIVSQNEINQNAAFKHFKWFYEKIENGMHNSRVIRSIVSRNRNLVKQCPKPYLNEMVQRILITGRKPEYLDLFVGLLDIMENGDHAFNTLKSQIAKLVTYGERSVNILQWCSATGTQAYEERVNAMKPYLEKEKQGIVVDSFDLSPDLRYHVNLLDIMAGCKLGPKLQAIYQLDDVAAALFDPNTIFCVKLRLGVLLVQLIQTKMENIEVSANVWKFVETCIADVKSAHENLGSWMRTGNDVVQMGLWLNICMDGLLHFFGDLDLDELQDFSLVDDSGFEITARSQEDSIALIHKLIVNIKLLKSRHKESISSKFHSKLGAVLDTLYQVVGQDNIVDDVTNTKRERSVAKRNQMNRTTSFSEEISQVHYRNRYKVFANEIFLSENDFISFSIETFDGLPSIHNNSSNSDVRLEPFILQVMQHIRSRIKRTASAYTLDKSDVNTILWVLKTIQNLLEKQINITIDVVTDPMKCEYYEEQSSFNKVLCDNNAILLCLDLIKNGIDSSISVAAANVLVMLLAKSGGCIDIQYIAYNYLRETDSSLFFEQIRDLIELQLLWCQKRIDDFNNEAEVFPPELVILKLIFLLTAGNFLPMKDIFREQPGNTRYVNILDPLSQYFNLLSRLENHRITQVGLRVAHCTVGLITGPAILNQEYIVLRTDLLISLNKILRAAKPAEDYTLEWDRDVTYLKEFIIDILRACIEEQHSTSLICDRVQTSIEINVLNVLIFPPELDEFGSIVEFKDFTPLQAKYLAFVKSLDDATNVLPVQVIDRAQTEICSVELCHDMQLIKYHFNIPKIASNLSGNSKLKIFETMNCVSQELKLKEFMNVARTLYREALLQETLKSFGMKNLWNIYKILALAMLCNALVINILMLYYYVEDYTDLYLPQEISDILFVLCSAQICSSICVMFICIIVRLPVRFKTLLATGYGYFPSFLLSVCDYITLWYIVYFVIAVYSLRRNYLFTSLLLLDFVMLDSTSKNVLMAVIMPARQLWSTFIMTMICIYITAAIIFLYYRNDYIHFPSDNTSMYNSLLLAFTFGIRAPEGVGQYMLETIGARMILDVGTYFVTVVLLRNIFFGIIINAFGEIRNTMDERSEHSANRCFVCGVDRYEFDKQSLEEYDFKYHREVTHNIENYLYFIIRLWQQPEDQDNGMENYIRKCIHYGDINWFPIGQIGVHENKSNNLLVKIDDTNNNMFEESPVTNIGNRFNNDAISDHDNEIINQRFGEIEKHLKELTYANTRKDAKQMSTRENEASNLTGTIQTLVKSNLNSGQNCSLALKNIRSKLSDMSVILNTLEKEKTGEAVKAAVPSHISPKKGLPLRKKKNM